VLTESQFSGVLSQEHYPNGLLYHVISVLLSEYTNTLMMVNLLPEDGVWMGV
jgi:hypothetical protein